MALAGRLRTRMRRILARPGTVDLSRYSDLLKEVDWREEKVRDLTDEELTEAAAALRDKAREETKKDTRPFEDADLIELCALGREAGRRALEERAHDVQLLGTMGLLAGHVVEMATGEGKTLSGALAAAGYALAGRDVHVLSVNDYLARRDAEWMGPVYALMGVTVGWVSQDSTPEERKAAYAKDVTYGAVSEVGFDVLRDRLVTDAGDRVQPPPGVALVDEADSVLVDEARVPLVMAGSAETEPGDPEVAKIVAGLRAGAHYEQDEDGRNAWLTDAGARIVERSLSGVELYTEEHSDRLAAVNVALHAHALLNRDVDYIVRDGKVALINSSRGRIALLQRWPDGLQAAVEAKEGVATSERGQVLDSITVQSMIGRYQRVCGMTGTAFAVAEQLREFYALEVAVIPPDQLCVRDDEPDRVYPDFETKESAIIELIVDKHKTGQPILVGTQDVAESERLAKLLAKAEVECVVLNARNDAEEASIVAEAGAKDAVTVSTQMAGRGTDIRLGGSLGSAEDVAELGGLYVLGTGHYPSSRLDDQLRGRAGRQGDPGGSVVFASLADDLVAQYAPEAEAGGEPDDDEGGRLTDSTSQNFVDHAQRVAEGVNLEIHRNTWRYTRLVEKQREILLEYRDEVLTGDVAAELLKERREKAYDKLVEAADEDAVKALARQIVLRHLDKRWTEHLEFVAEVRETIHLRALAKETPIDEFHRACIPAFKQIRPDVADAAAATFAEIEIGEDGTVDLEASSLRKPTSTWTYLVHDNPFDSDAEQALQKVRAMVKKVKK